jgi:hypothetical protein
MLLSRGLGCGEVEKRSSPVALQIGGGLFRSKLERCTLQKVAVVVTARLQLFRLPEEALMNKDDRIRQRDQERLQAMIGLSGPLVGSRRVRVLLQFFQAEDTCRLLAAAADMKAGLASAVLLRFGFDTIATGFWLAFVAPNAFFVGQGEEHILSDLSRIVHILPPAARDMLDEVLKRPVNNDPSKTLLSYVLNPATHGDALVNVQRIGSAPAAGFDWAVHLRDVMLALTNNFAVILREQAQIDVFKEMEAYNGSSPS